MKIKNYTSNVVAERSVMHIERYLVEAGASHIAKEYDTEKKLVGITFQMPLPNGQPMLFKMPARVEEVEKIMMAEKKKLHHDTKKRVKDHATRTAWKLLVDWEQVQCSMILLKQAEAIEIFLPYLYNPVTDQTFFNRIKDGGYKMLQSGKSA